MSQKAEFLSGEGDKWFNRNKETLKSSKFKDVVFLERYLKNQSIRNFLEIGCSNGYKTIQLAKILKSSAYGIDPSEVAISEAKSSSGQIFKSNQVSQAINFEVGTADELSFTDSKFDFIFFGFCLYLCDREDLFRIASEADRVLRSPGWLAILDFFSPTPRANEYHHLPGIKSYKMNYRTLFDWHPSYEVYTHKLRGDGEVGYTDNKDEWLSISILRKFQWS
jgi:ubiquinone/menaquinone biosynthesis C-methylase UbiE